MYSTLCITRYTGKIPTVIDNLQSVLPKHVLMQDWLPLNDLIGSSNTKLLISHCGANSQFEVSSYTAHFALSRAKATSTPYTKRYYCSDT